MLSRPVGLKSMVLIILVTLLLSAFAGADVRLAAVVGSNMVLQQQAKAPVWGWADPGEQITIEASWQKTPYQTAADDKGKWMVSLMTPKAGGPYKITIKGNNEIVLDNVLIGEVWICSGQSNMEMTVGRGRGFRVGVVNYEEEVAKANYPNIRLCTISKVYNDTVQENCGASWSVCTPEKADTFSAVGYFFGRELHKQLNVPIGLIDSTWGGTPAESWTRRAILEADEDLKPITDRYKQAWKNYIDQMGDYIDKMKLWHANASASVLAGQAIPDEPGKPGLPRGPKSPSVLYNSMIAPVIPYRIAGAIWYQGESNVRRAYQYRKLFPAMITNWRNDWGQGDFPFYFVQISPYRYSGDASSAELREAQLMTLSLPNTGMAVTTDIGDPMDIHPRNKQDVGKRLALWALVKDYGYDVVCSGPIYRSMSISGDKVRIFFDYAEDGLTTKGGELTDFTISGKDKVFVPAKAVIEGNTIVVSSEKVASPAAVRFGWSDTAEPNLFNKQGLPASPFRTDDWPGVTYASR